MADVNEAGEVFKCFERNGVAYEIAYPEPFEGYVQIIDIDIGTESPSGIETVARIPNCH